MNKTANTSKADCLKILITGGAGYIGSHVALKLLENTRHNIVILDNLSTGRKKTLDTLRSIRDFEFIELDLKEFDRVDEFLHKSSFDSIIHFAASIVVPESVRNPVKYYMNNTVNTVNLIKCAIDSSVERFIFSSTAAVYGEPDLLDESGIDESFKKEPISPYGVSKLMSEMVLQDTAIAHDNFKYVIFRYFNVAGADMNYTNNILAPRVGQNSQDATHLIKIASEHATQKREKVAIYGNDFNTKDGTGVRDYIHVDDLADAHIKAIEYLQHNDSDIFNIGYGRGASVKEVLATMQSVTNKDFCIENAPRRAGDSAFLVSNNAKIVSKMSWKPKYNDLRLICESAYEWEKSL